MLKVPEGIKVKVINENYKKSKDYEVGEILVKGRSIFKKYIASKKINSDFLITVGFVLVI